MKKRKLRVSAVISIIVLAVLILIGIWWIFFRHTDKEPPQIVLKSETVSLYVNDKWEPDTYITSIEDGEDGKLAKSDEEAKGSYWYHGDVDMSKAGEYTFEVHAMDQKGNKASKTIKITVKERPVEPTPQPQEEPKADPNEAAGNSSPASGSGGYDNSLDPQQAEPYYVNGILLVNKKHPLPPSFGALDPTAAAALAQLQSAAQNAGFSIPTISGFRTYDYQVTLYNSYVARDGQAAADTYSARPGFSEHQTGMVFDVGAIDNNYGNTAAGTWLREHCHEFGFIIRYPQGKENITGYMYEPWHIRYVGVDAATEIYQRGITLEEYLGVY